MGELVPVQCACGFRMQAEEADLGQDSVCPECGKSFVLWPAEPQGTDASVWYVKAGGRELGPFDVPALKKLVAEGRIQPQTPVRKGTEMPWVAAHQVRGLLTPTPPPPPPAAKPAAGRAARPRPVKPRPTARRGPAPKGRPVRHGHRAPAPRGDVAARLARQPGVVLAMAIGAVVIVVLVVVVAMRGKDDGGVSEDLAAGSNTEQPEGSGPKADRKGGLVSDVAQSPAKALPDPTKPLSTKQIVARAAPSVAVVLGRNGSGTGFLIEENLVATNRHVIADELLKDVRVRFPDAEKRLRGNYGVKLAYEDPELDLAFLYVEIDLPALPVAKKHEFTRGQEITVIGSPGVGDGQILQNAISRGLLSTQLQIEGQTYYQLDVAINPGNSGGPVFDERGLIIGVVTLKAVNKDGLGFCLPLESVRHSLARAKLVAPTDLAQMKSRHRLKVTALAVLRSSFVYARAGEVYVASMEAAIRAGVDLNEGLRLAMGEVRSQINRIDGALLLLVREEAPKILDDAALGEASRARFESLWTTYQALKTHVERPSGTLDSYKKQVENLSLARDRIAREFKSEEDIDEAGD